MTDSSSEWFNTLEIVEIDKSKNVLLENLINTKHLSLRNTDENCKISPHMTNLVSLKICGFEYSSLNSRQTINFDHFENSTTNIKHLDLSDNGLIYWNPLWSNTLINLKSLNLNYSSIYNWDKHDWKNDLSLFAGLINLKYLNLRRMGELKIDVTIFTNLKHLKYLDISENDSWKFKRDEKNGTKSIEVQQNVSTHLENLEYLIMESVDNITRFIFDNFKFDKLKKLSISGEETDFYKIEDDFFSKLPNSLIELSLTSILGLRLYDKCLSHLTNLKYLDLSYNELNFDGDNLFASQQKLEVLHLSWNYFGSPSTNWFNGLDSLRTLKLDVNVIDYLNIECVEKMKNLKYICLDHTVSNAVEVEKNLEDRNIICIVARKRRYDSGGFCF
jgi:Leucine-rich repeat (LRR) protein